MSADLYHLDSCVDPGGRESCLFPHPCRGCTEIPAQAKKTPDEVVVISIIAAGRVRMHDISVLHPNHAHGTSIL